MAGLRAACILGAMTFTQASRVRGLALAAALACTPRVHAQDALAAGSRVRVAADSGRSLTGNVLRLNADTLRWNARLSYARLRLAHDLILIHPRRC